jgi:hypothetical protein
MTEVTNPNQTALALPQSFLTELAVHAKDAAAKERPSAGRLSLKGGLSYDGTPVPGNKLEVVIVGGAYRNVLYKGRYDPDNITSPDCFALAVEDEDMRPHENVLNPENDTCKGCPMAEWGSSPTGGRGKACKETRRLVLLPANNLASADAIKGSEMAILDIPVTSVKNYRNLVNVVAGTLNLPVYAVIVLVEWSPDPKTQIKVTFTPLRVAGDEEIIRAIMARREEATRLATIPYDSKEPEDEQPVKAPTSTKKKF